MEAAASEENVDAVSAADSEPVVQEHAVTEEPKNTPQGFSISGDHEEEEDKQELKFGNLKFNENF